MRVTINCDMGEGYGIYRLGDDAAIMPYVDLANVACGFHASDPTVMRKTIKLAKSHGVRVGAHPSLPDRQGFGRRRMDVSPAEVLDMVTYQVGALKAFLDSEGMSLSHVKPHGSLYGMTTVDERIAAGLAQAVASFAVPVLGMAYTAHEAVFRDHGIELIPEFYADLAYDDTGNVIAPLHHDAIDAEQACERAMRALAEERVTTITGQQVRIRAQTICVHSDTPTAIAIAARLSAAIGRTPNVPA